MQVSADVAVERVVIKEISARMREILQEFETRTNETIRRYHERIAKKG
jgi:hypothetical protein